MAVAPAPWSAQERNLRRTAVGGARSFGLKAAVWRSSGERLKLGEARTTPLIRSVKDEAKGDVVIVDCPPGTSCSMVESVRGTDFWSPGH